MFGIVVYLTVTIPSLRAIADQTADETYSDQVMALRVLSAGNIIIIGSLLLILALQVSGLIWKKINKIELSVDRCVCRLDRNGHVGKKLTLLLNP